jgi:hypothetical protein
MDRRRWLERVADELAGRGLPAGVRGRLLAELRDHLEDLTEGGADMATAEEVGQRMGEPGELAAAAAAEYRKAVWVRRHPLLVFGLAPAPAVLLGITVYMLAIAAVGYAMDSAGVSDESLSRDGLVRAVAAFVWYGVGFVPFLAATAAFGWLAARSGVRGRWLAAAVVQVALFGGMAVVQLNWSDLPGESQLLLGFGFPLVGWRQAAQLLLPLTLGWLSLRAAGRRAAAAA